MPSGYYTRASCRERRKLLFLREVCAALNHGKDILTGKSSWRRRRCIGLFQEYRSTRECFASATHLAFPAEILPLPVFFLKDSLFPGSSYFEAYFPNSKRAINPRCTAS